MINLEIQAAKFISSLSVLTRVTTDLEEKVRKVCHSTEHTQCLRHIWSLAHFNHWTFRLIAAIRNKEKQTSPTYPDVSQSVSSLIKAKQRFREIIKRKSAAAKNKIGSGMKKAVFSARAKVRKRGNEPSKRRKPKNHSHMKKTEKPIMEKGVEVIVGTSTSEMPNPSVQETGKAKTLNIDASLDKALVSSNPKTHKDMAMECLACENLVTCNFRTNLSSGHGGQTQNELFCHFAELSLKNKPAH